ncbi:hypothetical protein BLNAU_14146 [Blattamonas nauphoetae]|uniref:Right handed beta helix domain-containing protein n=1 Tax=Blattamonas nauphoetae TaxID=2049346 RepID=A0ABQ9XIC1_9EUKA|nr:hypothetical protein BLNAU_14146 [Blattamonas nauphoetae]
MRIPPTQRHFKLRNVSIHNWAFGNGIISVCVAYLEQPSLIVRIAVSAASGERTSLLSSITSRYISMLEQARFLISGCRMGLRLIGVSVSESTNHLSGTSGVPLDWAVSSLLSNCSYSSCISNAAPSPITEPIYDEIENIDLHRSKSSRIEYYPNFGDPIQNAVWIVSCGFDSIVSNMIGGAVVLSNYLAAVVVKDSSFKDCLTTSSISFGGGICVSFSSDSSDGDTSSFTLFNCRFSNNSAITGGHIHVQYYKPVTIAKCTFADSQTTPELRFPRTVSIHILFAGDCRLDNSTLTNNVGREAGGIGFQQDEALGSIILSGVLFEDNVCTNTMQSNRVTDCIIYETTSLPKCQFFDCFSTSDQPHCGTNNAEQLLPNWIGPSITSVERTTQANENGDGFELLTSFEGVFTGTRRKYEVTFEAKDGQRAVIEGASFTKSLTSAPKKGAEVNGPQNMPVRPQLANVCLLSSSQYISRFIRFFDAKHFLL